MTLIITKGQYKLLDRLAHLASLATDEDATPADRRALKITSKKASAAKIPDTVKTLAIAIGNNWARYTSDAFSFLLRDAGILILGVTYFKEG